MSTKARPGDLRADHGVVSIVLAADHDLTAAAESIDALRRLRADGNLEIEIVLASASEHHTRIADLADDAVCVDAGAAASSVHSRNAGAEAARGEHLAFLTPGFRPDPEWISGALEALHADARAALCASWVLDGDIVRFATSGLTATGDPLSIDEGRARRSVPAIDHEVLFPSNDAFVVDARAFAFASGFDETFGTRIAAADLGWRLALAGLGAVSSARSAVQWHASEPEVPHADPDSLSMLVKNLGEATLAGLLGAATIVSGGRPGGPEALKVLEQRMPALLVQRAAIQSSRAVPDSQILPLFRDPAAVPGLERGEVQEILDGLGAAEIFRFRRKIAVVTPDVLREKMAGPAIRAWRMAIALSRDHDVRLATTVDCEIANAEFPVSHVDDQGLRALDAWCDVLVFQGHVMNNHPWLRKSPKVLVADIYDPIHLEVLEQSRDQSDWDRRASARHTVEVLNEQLARADHLLCASDKQRDFWLGQLAGVGRLNPATYDDGENLENLITVVPFGLDDHPPQRTRPAIRGVVPGIGPADKVIIWGGGIYNWFDPLTLVRAIDKLRQRVPEVRLFFMGLQHPNPNVPKMRMAYETQRLASDLGITDTHVFFNDGWVDYSDRQNYLLDADIGVSTHLDHVETAYSFRTRILDYLWASLPIVATAGDSFGDLIELHELGITVAAEDVDGLEIALYQVLTDDDFAARCRANVEKLAPAYRWNTVLEPVLEICAAARRAPDLVDPRQRVMIGDPIAQEMWGRRGLAHDLRVALGHLRRREYSDVSRKLRWRVRTALFPETAGAGRRG